MFVLCLSLCHDVLRRGGSQGHCARMFLAEPFDWFAGSN